jgi:hypothetical protein
MENEGATLIRAGNAKPGDEEKEPDGQQSGLGSGSSRNVTFLLQRKSRSEQAASMRAITGRILMQIRTQVSARPACAMDDRTFRCTNTSRDPLAPHLKRIDHTNQHWMPHQMGDAHRPTSGTVPLRSGAVNPFAAGSQIVRVRKPRGPPAGWAAIVQIGLQAAALFQSRVSTQVANKNLRGKNRISPPPSPPAAAAMRRSSSFTSNGLRRLRNRTDSIGTLHV